jgi:hypothetical protein
MVINGIGALTTALVTIIVSVTKFTQGAWIVVLLIPLLVLMFKAVHRHYQHVERVRITDLPISPEQIHHRLIVPVNTLDPAALQSIAYARSISPLVTVVHVAMNDVEADKVRADWDRWQKQHLKDEEETHLLVIESPYRSLLPPLLAYIDTIHERHPSDTVSVILPEFVVSHWWEHFLHNQTALRLKTALFFRPGIVVIDVPLHLSDRARPAIVQ